MTGVLLAEFSNETRLLKAAREARGAHCRLLDAFTPFPVEGILELLEHRRSHIRVAMFIGGVATAALAYGLEYYSAVVNYPYNSGGRPFDAWPAFMLVPFATAILVAAIAGFAALLVETGLPRLCDPLFAVHDFDRASQDRFMLAVERPAIDDDRRRAVDFLRNAGAIWVREIER